MDKNERLKLNIKYRAKYGIFERKYAGLEAGSKLTPKLQKLSVELWLLAHQLKKDIPEDILKVFISAVEKKFMLSDKDIKEAKKRNEKRRNLIVAKHDSDDLMYERINNNYLEQQEAYDNDNGLPKPTLQKAYKNYQKTRKNEGVNLTITEIKKAFERLSKERKKCSDPEYDNEPIEDIESLSSDDEIMK